MPKNAKPITDQFKLRADADGVHFVRETTLEEVMVEARTANKRFLKAAARLQLTLEWELRRVILSRRA